MTDNQRSRLEKMRKREREGWVKGRISYCSRHCLLDTRQGRERQVQGPPLSLADDYRKRELQLSSITNEGIGLNSIKVS